MYIFVGENTFIAYTLLKYLERGHYSNDEHSALYITNRFGNVSIIIAGRDSRLMNTLIVR